MEPQISEQQKQQITDAVAKGKITAAQVNNDCPTELEDWCKRVAAHLESTQKYQKKIQNNDASIGKLLALIAEACDESGFEACREKFYPKLGRSRTFELKAIAAGRKTSEQSKAENRERVARHRAKQESVTPHVTDSNAVEVKGNDATRSAEERKRLYEAQDDARHVDALKIKPATVVCTGNAENAEAAIDDPLVIENGTDWPGASPWFASKMKPIFEGSIKNDPAQSASALAEFRKACAALLPQMTVVDLQTARSIVSVVADIESDVEDAVWAAEKAKANAKRIAWEAKNPDKAKEKARDKAQADEMENDIGEAKAEARENGERWSDIRDEWSEDWIANNWDEEAETNFEREFQEQWQKDHGKSWAPSKEAAAWPIGDPAYKHAAMPE